MKTKKIAVSVGLCIALSAAFGLAACGGAADDKKEPEVQPTVQSLVITHDADKSVYEQGEIFDTAGMTVKAIMSDGSVVDNVEFKCKKKDALTPQDTVVPIAYGGKTVYYDITVKYKGNNAIYSVEQTAELQSSPLFGNTYFFLGSSVTAGSGSEGEAMGEFLAKRNNCTVIREAVSGTTLADIDSPQRGKSYVKRLDEYLASDACVDSIDVFVCQLSTNDMSYSSTFGIVTDSNVVDAQSFDKATTFGAMEYIVARVTEKWSCPILFYTNNNLSNPGYVTMVQAAHSIEDKYEQVYVLDLYNDVEFNNISTEERALWMTDIIHPTKAGYRDWWIPKFESILTSIEQNND